MEQLSNMPITASFGNKLFGGNVVVRPGPIKTPVIDYIIIAGGGGGGTFGGGGGGAGGYLQGTGSPVDVGATYNVIVGGGGYGGNGGTGWISGQGGDSSLTRPSPLATVNATGGGPGGRRVPGFPADAPYGGYNGGCGGGGAFLTPSPGPNNGGLGTPGQGNNGGRGSIPPSGQRGGGGGGIQTFGEQGGPAPAVFGAVGEGGRGFDLSFTEESGLYLGGGGGGGGSPGNPGGLGGPAGGGPGSNVIGGNGGNGLNTPAGSAVQYTGSGGGGGGNGPTDPHRDGGSGAGGRVIIRYSKYYDPLQSTSGSPTFKESLTYKIYDFTGSGSFTI